MQWTDREIDRGSSSEERKSGPTRQKSSAFLIPLWGCGVATGHRPLVGLSDSLARVWRRWEAGCLATNNSFDGNSLPQVRNPGTWKSKLETHRECLGRAPATLWKRKDWWRHCGWRNSRVPTWHSYTRKFQKLLRQVSNVNTTVTQGKDPEAQCKCTGTAKSKHHIQGGLASHAIFAISIHQLQCHF